MFRIELQKCINMDEINMIEKYLKNIGTMDSYYGHVF